MQGSTQVEPIVVGIALKKEKRKKHISDKLVAKAAEAGITIRFVDKERELEAQGPFVAILQKVRKPDWEQALVEYAAAHPEVQVFDLPAATYPLRNRGTMVSFLDGDGWLFEEPPELVEPGRLPQRCRCNVPTSTTLAEGSSLAAALRQMDAAGLRFPVLAKPLWADGREGSHALAVVHTPRGLERLVEGQAAYLQLPIMLQQYVDHGGCLFKVYVLGDTSVRVKRNSLHLPAWPRRAADTQQGAPTGAAAAACAGAAQQGKQQQAEGGSGQQGAQSAAAPGLPQQQQQQQGEEGSRGAGGRDGAPADPELPDLELMERVSAYPASKSWGRADTAPKGHGVPSPPAWLLQAVAQRLRRKTGLNLFNFDVIVPMEQHRRRMPHQQSGGQLSSSQLSAGAAEAALAAADAAAVAQAQQVNGSTGAAPPAAADAGRGVSPAVAVAASQSEAEQEEEEPAVVDLQAASAAAAEAAAAAAAAEGGASAGAGAGAATNGAAPSPTAMAPAPAAQPPAVAGGAGPAASAQQQQGQQAQEAGDQSKELLYHLIDINYFPGYEKMPNYEEYMVQFLRSICFPRGGQRQDQRGQQQQQQQQPEQQQLAAAVGAQ